MVGESLEWPAAELQTLCTGRGANCSSFAALTLKSGLPSTFDASDPWRPRTVGIEPPFRNAQIHAVIMFFVTNVGVVLDLRRRQCDEAISSKGSLSIVIRGKTG
jgi:hypothetical protein